MLSLFKRNQSANANRELLNEFRIVMKTLQKDYKEDMMSLWKEIMKVKNDIKTCLEKEHAEALQKKDAELAAALSRKEEEIQEKMAIALAKGYKEENKLMSISQEEGHVKQVLDPSSRKHLLEMKEELEAHLAKLINMEICHDIRKDIEVEIEALKVKEDEKSMAENDVNLVHRLMKKTLLISEGSIRSLETALKFKASEVYPLEKTMLDESFFVKSEPKVCFCASHGVENLVEKWTSRKNTLNGQSCEIKAPVGGETLKEHGQNKTPVLPWKPKEVPKLKFINRPLAKDQLALQKVLKPKKKDVPHFLKVKRNNEPQMTSPEKNTRLVPFSDQNLPTKMDRRTDSRVRNINSSPKVKKLKKQGSIDRKTQIRTREGNLKNRSYKP